MSRATTKMKRYELYGIDGWPCEVIRIDKVEDGTLVRTWSLKGQRLTVTPDGRLVLPGTDTSFVLPEVYDDEDEPD